MKDAGWESGVLEKIETVNNDHLGLSSPKVFDKYEWILFYNQQPITRLEIKTDQCGAFIGASPEDVLQQYAEFISNKKRRSL